MSNSTRSRRRPVVITPVPNPPIRIKYTIEQLIHISNSPMCAPNSPSDSKAKGAVVPHPVIKKP